MRVLIVYGTSEGHTRDLAHVMTDRLRRMHIGVSVHDAAEDEGPLICGYDGIIVAASLHLGRYQSSAIQFARRNHCILAALPSAFVSVSLSAAGYDAADWAGLDSCLDAFERRTHWTPTMVHHAAGAIPFTQFDIFRKLVFKEIAAKRGHHLTTSEDHDFTDYDLLAGFIDGFVEAVRQATHRQDEPVGQGAAA